MCRQADEWLRAGTQAGGLVMEEGGGAWCTGGTRCARSCALKTRSRARRGGRGAAHPAAAPAPPPAAGQPLPPGQGAGGARTAGQASPRRRCRLWWWGAARVAQREGWTQQDWAGSSGRCCCRRWGVLRLGGGRRAGVGTQPDACVLACMQSSRLARRVMLASIWIKRSRGAGGTPLGARVIRRGDRGWPGGQVSSTPYDQDGREPRGATLDPHLSSQDAPPAHLKGVHWWQGGRGGTVCERGGGGGGAAAVPALRVVRAPLPSPETPATLTAWSSVLLVVRRAMAVGAPVPARRARCRRSQPPPSSEYCSTETASVEGGVQGTCVRARVCVGWGGVGGELQLLRLSRARVQAVGGFAHLPSLPPPPPRVAACALGRVPGGSARGWSPPQVAPAEQRPGGSAPAGCYHLLASCLQSSRGRCL